MLLLLLRLSTAPVASSLVCTRALPWRFLDHRPFSIGPSSLELIVPCVAFIGVLLALTSFCRSGSRYDRATFSYNMPKL